MKQEQETMNRLLQSKKELLEQIAAIEETCEGTENKNNASKLQKYSARQAQLSGEKKQLETRLQAVVAELALVNKQASEVSGSGMDKILEAISKQRWWFFKNKPNIMFDRLTGLAWPNIDTYEFHWSPNWERENAYLKDIQIDGFRYWHVPEYKGEWISAFAGHASPALKGGGRLKGQRYFRVTGGGWPDACDSLYEGIGTWSNAPTYPCSQALTMDSNYWQSQNRKDLSAVDKAKLTWNVFVEHGLVPSFDEADVQAIYDKIFKEKPALVKQLQVVEEKLQQLEQQVLLSSEFDYRNLLAKFDLEAINASVINYYRAVQEWVEELEERLKHYESVKAEVLNNFSNLGLKLEQNYEDRDELDYEANSLLRKSHEWLKRKLLLEMSGVHGKLQVAAEQAKMLEERLEMAEESEECFRELAELEKEPRPSFTFLAENTGKIITNALVKLEFYEANKELVARVLQLQDKWISSCGQWANCDQALIQQAEKQKLAESLVEAWNWELQSLRNLCLQKLLPLLQAALQKEMVQIKPNAITIPEQLLDQLLGFGQQLSRLYMDRRLKLYQDNKQKGDLKERVELTKAYLAIIKDLQIKTAEIAFNCKDSRDRIFVLQSIQNIVNYPNEQLRQFILNNDLPVPVVKLQNLAKLTWRSYDAYVGDINSYSRETQARNQALLKLLDEIVR